MKKIILLIVCAVSFAATQAQVDLGVKGGFNLANLVGPDVDDNSIKLSFYVGGYAKLPLADRFSVQPELVFSRQGAKFEDPGDDDKYRLNYLNIPVMFQYNDPSGFYGETGPQFGFKVSAKVKGDGDTYDISDAVKGFDFSWGFGAGYKFTEKASAGIRWNLGITDVWDGSSKVRNSVFQIGLAYKLHTTK